MKAPKVFSPRHRREGAKTFVGGLRARTQEMYNTPEWESYRSRYLNINSKCYSCGEQAQVVDHLVPHQGDTKLFEKLDNHIPLCKRCHNRVTALFDRKYQRGSSIEPKIKWLKANRQALGLTFKVKVLPRFRE